QEAWGMPFVVKIENGAEIFQQDSGFTNTSGLWMRSSPSEPLKEIIPFGQESVEVISYFGGYIYAMTQGDLQTGQLVRFTPDAPDKREILVPEVDGKYMRDYLAYDGKIYLKYRQNVNAQASVYDTANGIVTEMQVPDNCDLVFLPNTRDKSGFDVHMLSFTEPEAVWHYNAANNKLEPPDTPAVEYALNDCIVEQKWAISKDGTRVPMTVVRHPDTELDGTAALLIDSYGASGLSRGPNFSSEMLGWVRSGGIFVEANLRGGGEFGIPWNEGGGGVNKPNTFDDLAACARQLQSEGYSSPARTALIGGSAGGMTVLCTMQKYPELFGAVLAMAPATDTFKLLHGDLGDPKGDRKIFDTMLSYSPLLNIKKGVEYPPHLIWQGTNDSRVPPWHAQKFVAETRHVDPHIPCYLYMDEGGDHFGSANGEYEGDGRRIATMLAFAETAIGPLAQKDFRKSLESGLSRGKGNLRQETRPRLNR
ncbi:MAG: prolyl oligopeptidase family serine peptidase, partial [Bdellovibrionales bacterium]